MKVLIAAPLKHLRDSTTSDEVLFASWWVSNPSPETHFRVRFLGPLLGPIILGLETDAKTELQAGFFGKCLGRYTCREVRTVTPGIEKS